MPGNPIGISNLPNQRHRIVSRKGGSFTLMVVGGSGLGKTTFINTLFATTIKDHKTYKRSTGRTVDIDIIRAGLFINSNADLIEKGFNIRLNVIDTPGFTDHINNNHCWTPIINFIDEQHLSYMNKENGMNRLDIDDLRINACLYFISPTGHNLSAIDIKTMKLLSGRVNVIPVIAKADTITHGALKAFKQRIRECIAENEIKIYLPPQDEEGESETEEILVIFLFYF